MNYFKSIIKPNWACLDILYIVVLFKIIICNGY